MTLSSAVSTWSLRSWSSPLLKRKKKSLSKKNQIPKLLRRTSDDSTVESINKCDSVGRNLLFYAASFGTYEVADQLLKTGCDPNIRDFEGDTALHEAVLNGHTKVINLLIKKAEQLKIDAKNDMGETPLMVAVFQDQIDVVKLLHKAGAEIHETDKLGRTPLLVAAEQGSEKCFHYLLKHNGDIYQRDFSGRSVLYYALHADNLSIPIIKQILKSGYDVSTDAKWLIGENYTENGLKELNPKLCKSIMHKIGVPEFEKDCYCRRPSIGNVILTRISRALVTSS